ncbi:MAG: penicillin-binding protein [Chrysiogenetes bacterium]|nr:penicillin-binding protein [Chrysiogenetes bacterium]
MMDPHTERRIRRRVMVLGGLGVLWALGLLVRAWDLQVRSADKLNAMAARQHTKKVTLKARRGMVFDRNGAELAISLPVESIFAQPAELEDAADAAKKLAKILDTEEAPLRKRLSQKNRGFVWVARQVDADKITKVRALDFSGIGFIEESKRHYPGGELAGHVLGFAGIDSVGLEGIEYTYNRFLRGNAEEVVGARDARGRAILARGLGSLEKLKGDHLTLTIDSTIQSIAERELADARELTGARAGTATVMDPRTGEILAMAVEPRFDPNNFEKFTSNEFRNRTVTDIFEPGSTMKPFLLSSAMEEGVVAPNDIFFCENGDYEVYDRTFHDTKPHGWLSAANILRVSSNIGAIKISERLGGQKYYDYLRRFGFGHATGIDLAGEADGLLAAPSRWSGVSLPAISFGQGMGVTAIQMVAAAGALANEGILHKPTVLKEVRDGEGRLIQRTVPQVVDRVLSESTARRITGILEKVVADDGTGRNAQIPGYRVAGKTGTAQKIDPETGKYSSQLRVVSFLGYVPASAPRLVILVTLDEPEGMVSGGGTAGPAFARIASQALAYLEVPPDKAADDITLEDPVGDLIGSITQHAAHPGEGASALSGTAFQVASLDSATGQSIAASDGRVPSFMGMALRDVIGWQGAGRVSLHWQGHGVVVGQMPPPGAPLEPGMKVSLELRPPG